MKSPITIRRIDTHEDLGAALREARMACGLTQEEVEHRVGLTGRHLGKIENGSKEWGKSAFKITQTLRWLLEWYGLTFVLMDKRTAALLTGPRIEKLAASYHPRADTRPRPNSQRLTFQIVRFPETKWPPS